MGVFPNDNDNATANPLRDTSPFIEPINAENAIASTFMDLVLARDGMAQGESTRQREAGAAEIASGPEREGEVVRQRPPENRNPTAGQD